jgi:hypothetical protein
MFVQGLAQCRDMDVEISLFDDTAGPQPRHELVPADDLTLSLGQRTQDAKRAPVNPHRLTIAPQFGAPKIEPKTSEADLLVLHRIRLKLYAVPNF